jgi:hypothetical protein
MNIDSFEIELRNAGNNAANNHPESKRRADANHQDNFALWISSTVDNAMMNYICQRLKERDVIDWLNENTKKGRNSRYNAIVMQISRDAWFSLRD